MPRATFLIKDGCVYSVLSPEAELVHDRLFKNKTSSMERLSNVLFNEEDQIWEVHDRLSGDIIYRHKYRNTCICMEIEYYIELLRKCPHRIQELFNGKNN